MIRARVHKAHNRLGRIAAGLRSNADEATHEAAEAIASHARSTVAVRSGETRSSIHVSDTGKGSRVEAGGAAKYLENGTRKMAARPFLVPSTEGERPRVGSRFRNLVR